MTNYYWGPGADLTAALATKLSINGSNSMIGNLNVGGHLINNVIDPVAASDGANKNYVDTTLTNNYLRLDGTNTMTGSLNMGTHKITNVVNPTSAQDAATKNYVDTDFLKLDGTNTMTGSLNMGTNKIIEVVDPTAAQDGATKSYVDSGIATLSTQVNNLITQLSDAAVYTKDTTVVAIPTVLTQAAINLDTSITPNPSNIPKLNVATATFVEYPTAGTYIWLVFRNNGTYTLTQEALFSNSAGDLTLTRELKYLDGTVIVTAPQVIVYGGYTDQGISLNLTFTITGATTGAPKYVGAFVQASGVGITRTSSNTNVFQVSTSDSSTNWGVIGNNLAANGILGSLTNFDVSVIRNNITYETFNSTGINMFKGLSFYQDNNSSGSGIVIKQQGQTDTNAGASKYGIMFINNGSTDEFYMGYGVGGVLGIYNKNAGGVFSRFLAISSGGISAESLKVTNVSNPTSAQDAATKNYVDTSTANTNYVKKDGTVAMTGALNMGTHLINNVVNPVSAQDAATKNYVDTSIGLFNTTVVFTATVLANANPSVANWNSFFGSTNWPIFFSRSGTHNNAYVFAPGSPFFNQILEIEIRSNYTQFSGQINIWDGVTFSILIGTGNDYISQSNEFQNGTNVINTAVLANPFEFQLVTGLVPNVAVTLTVKFTLISGGLIPG